MPVNGNFAAYYFPLNRCLYKFRYTVCYVFETVSTQGMVTCQYLWMFFNIPCNYWQEVCRVKSRLIVVCCPKSFLVDVWIPSQNWRSVTGWLLVYVDQLLLHCPHLLHSFLFLDTFMLSVDVVWRRYLAQGKLIGIPSSQSDLVFPVQWTQNYQVTSSDVGCRCAVNTKSLMSLPRHTSNAMNIACSVKSFK